MRHYPSSDTITGKYNVLSKEDQEVLSRRNIYVFVDGADFGKNLMENSNLAYAVNRMDRSIRKLVHHCRNFGRVQEAHVFDDTWRPASKALWVQEGCNVVHVGKEGAISRVPQVLSLRAFQTASRLAGNCSIVLIVGSCNYQELIEEIQRLGLKIILISIDEVHANTVKRRPDVWIHFEKLVPNIDTRTYQSDKDDYDWRSFVTLVHSLQNSNLDFVGVKHLIRKVLPTIGVYDTAEGHRVVERAEAQGILEMYKVPNPKGPYPVQACRLFETNPIVKGILQHSEE